MEILAPALLLRALALFLHWAYEWPRPASVGAIRCHHSHPLRCLRQYRAHLARNCALVARSRNTR